MPARTDSQSPVRVRRMSPGTPSTRFADRCRVVRSHQVRLDGIRPEVLERGAVAGTLTLADTSRMPIAILTTHSHVGGFKRWFGCPQCGRRVGCLYRPTLERGYACRHCWRLKYLSQYRRWGWLRALLWTLKIGGVRHRGRGRS
jgi:hypothetical protein